MHKSTNIHFDIVSYSSFSYLIPLPRTYSTVLNRSDESRIHCLVPSLSRKTFSLSLNVMLAISFSQIFYVEEISFYS